MATSGAIQESHIDVGGASVRSRASSVFSTGTKFSVSTLPQEEFQSSGAGFAERIARNAGRAQSLMTLASHETPAPPYEVCQAPEVPQSSPAQHRLTAVQHLGSFTTVTCDTPSTSPASEPENALSMHYGQVVRTIDQNHALELTRLANEHERHLAAVRHEIDQAYRREWKAKNREVEKFREDANARVAALEIEYQNQANVHAAAIAKLQQETRDQLAALAEEHELATDRARNAIEDLWEGRWRDRVRLADEEAWRMDLENQRRLEQAIADRDEEWVKELGKRHPELLDELRDIISGLRAGT